MRRALIWLLMLLLPACASAQTLLPQLVAQKQAAQEAQAGMYAYTLTVRNLGESAVERIFVEESGAMGDTLFPEGAFTDFEGGDALLNQNGTATILRLDPGQTVTLRYEGALPQHFAQTAVQTECAISAMYRDAAGESYLLLALADQPVPLAESRPAQTVPTEEAAAAGGKPVLDSEKCVYCTLCAKKCPQEAIHVERKEKIWKLDDEKCVECGICAGACPKKAIGLKE